MTKDEALNAIDRARGEYTWEGSRHQIREIVEQIDQPQEFTVRELVELLGQIGNNIRVESLHYDGYWQLTDKYRTFMSQGFGIDKLKAKLTELAAPQPPSDKVTVQIDRKLAEFIADYRDGDLSVACREALKGTQP